MEAAICNDLGGCYDTTPSPLPESAYELTVESTRFVVIPEVPEYTVDLETLYAWGELQRN